MKSDRYKDWESRFFDGEPLTPEEELFLKNESDNPYFSFLKDEKTEKLDLSFEEFLKKTEQPEEIKVIPIKKTIPMMYWLAASLVIMFGLVVFWMQPTAQDAEKQIAHQNVVKDDVAEKSSIEKPIGYEKVNEVNEVAIAKTEIKHKNSQKQQNNELGQHNVYLADYQFKEHKADNQKSGKNGMSDYNPNYVIINGKPIYNEQEAIAITEDTFNYFASNVSQTITEAENAQNMSKDLYNIINF